MADRRVEDVRLLDLDCCHGSCPWEHYRNDGVIVAPSVRELVVWWLGTAWSWYGYRSILADFGCPLDGGR